jgi:hypothetical protein
MSKAKAALQKVKRELSGYKFDTSTYIILDAGVRRDASTGMLTVHSAEPKVSKRKSK